MRREELRRYLLQVQSPHFFVSSFQHSIFFPYLPPRHLFPHHCLSTLFPIRITLAWKLTIQSHLKQPFTLLFNRRGNPVTITTHIHMVIMEYLKHGKPYFSQYLLGRICKRHRYNFSPLLFTISSRCSHCIYVNTIFKDVFLRQRSNWRKGEATLLIFHTTGYMLCNWGQLGGKK